MKTHTILRNAKGFTIIEAIITAIVAGILAGAMLFVITLFSSQVNESTLRAKLQMDYDMMSQQIGSFVRLSKYVFQPGETEKTVLSSTTMVTTPEIRLYLRSNSPDTANYRIDGSSLIETINGVSRTYSIAGKPVVLASGSNFTLSPDRKTVTVKLYLVMNYKSLADTLIVAGDKYACRN